MWGDEYDKQAYKKKHRPNYLTKLQSETLYSTGIPAYRVTHSHNTEQN